MTIAYRLLPGGYVDATGPHRGVPPTEDDFRWMTFQMAHRILFGPYDAEIKQEITVEEAERRYPNANVSEKE